MLLPNSPQLCHVNVGKDKAWNPILTVGGADIQGSKIVFDYTGGSSPAVTIQGLLTTSYHAAGPNHFDTGKFKSTTADASRGLGWADNGVDQVKVAYTFYGDATLDGYVDSNDLTKVLANYLQGPIVPGITALGLDAQAIQMLTAAGFTVVPEPSTLVLLAAGFAALAGWMIRRRK